MGNGTVGHLGERNSADSLKVRSRILKREDLDRNSVLGGGLQLVLSDFRRAEEGVAASA